MKTQILAAVLSLALATPAFAATYVYVSNAEDGEIGSYVAASGRLVEAGAARCCRQGRDADGSQPGQALPDRGGALQAI